jgi:hypothetical protein
VSLLIISFVPTVVIFLDAEPHEEFDDIHHEFKARRTYEFDRVSLLIISLVPTVVIFLDAKPYEEFDDIHRE